MATRPVFIADSDNADNAVVREPLVEFKWIPGMARSQAQKCIRSLHDAARGKLGLQAILEISSKSEQPNGVALSAFNLLLTVDGIKRPLECVYQSSKVFSGGGPFLDLLEATPLEAKRDGRLNSSGPLRGFEFENHRWELTPTTAFYDYLYIKALAEDSSLSKQLEGFNAFTDIAFNPKKSFSCQARSAALFVVLNSSGHISEYLSSPESFLEGHVQYLNNPDAYDRPRDQGELFLS